MAVSRKDRDDKARIALVFASYLSIRDIAEMFHVDEMTAVELVARGKVLAGKSKEGAA